MVLELIFFDVNKSTPVTGVPLTCKVVMSGGQPQMSGVIPNYKVHKTHQELVPGVYTMPILFGVGGGWTVEYQADMPNGKEYERGVKNLPDVLGALQKYVDSKRQYAERRKEYHSVRATLLELLGK